MRNKFASPDSEVRSMIKAIIILSPLQGTPEVDGAIDEIMETLNFINQDLAPEFFDRVLNELDVTNAEAYITEFMEDYHE